MKSANKLALAFTTAMLLNLLVMCTMIGCVHYSKPATTSISFEDCVKSDLEWMDKRYGSNYRWYECGIKMKSYLDEDNDGAIEDLTNVFMIRSDSGKSYDTNVILLHHGKEGFGIYNLESKWVEEDVPMYREQINVIYKESLIKAKSVKLIPHTKHVVLRKQLGPINENPQYIYGNNHGLLFVDATTGYVSHESPAFEGTGFVTWLGEWPE